MVLTLCYHDSNEWGFGKVFKHFIELLNKNYFFVFFFFEKFNVNLFNILMWAYLFFESFGWKLFFNKNILKYCLKLTYKKMWNLSKNYGGFEIMSSSHNFKACNHDFSSQFQLTWQAKLAFSVCWWHMKPWYQFKTSSETSSDT